MLDRGKKAKELPKEPTGEYILPVLTSSFMNQGLNYFAPKTGATIIKMLFLSHLIAMYIDRTISLENFQYCQMPMLLNGKIEIKN